MNLPSYYFMIVIYQWLLGGFTIFHERTVLAIDSFEQKIQYYLDFTKLFTLKDVVSWVLEKV